MRQFGDLGTNRETVHRASPARPRGQRPNPQKCARRLDVVVAAGRIPQDVVFLGLDGDGAAGVHSAGRPGRREARKAPERLREDGRIGVTRPCAGRHIDRELAAIVPTALISSVTRSSPRTATTGQRPEEERSSTPATGRRSVVGTRELKPTAPSSSIWSFAMPGGGEKAATARAGATTETTATQGRSLDRSHVKRTMPRRPQPLGSTT